MGKEGKRELGKESKNERTKERKNGERGQGVKSKTKQNVCPFFPFTPCPISSFLLSFFPYVIIFLLPSFSPSFFPCFPVKERRKGGNKERRIQ